MESDVLIDLTIVVTFFKNIDDLNKVLNSISQFAYSYYNNIEIILVNDSGDNSKLTILNNYNFKIQIIELKENVGVTEARNIGYKNAIGNFILFYDSDDFLLPNSYNHFSNFININNADIYLFRCVDIDGNIIGDNPKVTFSNTPNIFYGNGERILCIKNGYKDPFIGFLRGNEHSGLLRLAYNHKPILFCSSDFPIRLYNINPNGLSSKIDKIERIKFMFIGHLYNFYYSLLLGDFKFALRFLISAFYRLSRIIIK